VPRLELSVSPNEQLSTALAELEAQQYAILRLVPPGLEPAFAQGARLLSARASTAIEFTYSARDDMTEVLTGARDPQSEGEFAAIDLQRAYEQARQLASHGSEIDHGVIRSLNSLLQSNSRQPGARTRGQYRMPGGPDVTIRDRLTNEVLYFPPKSDAVRELMDRYLADLAGWIADPEIDGRLAAALAHLGLVSIHPFEDGNGRTARLIADMVLDLTDTSIQGMVSVSSAIDASGSDYVNALRRTQGLRFVEELDATPFVTYHSEQLGVAARALLRSVTAVSRAVDDTEDGWIYVHLFLFGSVSTSQLMRLAGISRNTAASRLRALAERGRLERVGAGRNTRYVLPSGVREEYAEYVVGDPA
jgi:Fic family protein